MAILCLRPQSNNNECFRRLLRTSPRPAAKTALSVQNLLKLTKKQYMSSKKSGKRKKVDQNAGLTSTSGSDISDLGGDMSRRKTKVTKKKSKSMVRTLPFTLDKIKAINKKLAKTHLQKTEVSVRGKANNRQIVVKCDTANYELIKTGLAIHLKQSGFTTKESYNKDLTGLVVSFTSFVESKDNSTVKYTVNFYNTTNTLLVNGLSDCDHFLSHFEATVDQIPKELSHNINQEIRDHCEQFLSKTKEASSSGNSDALVMKSTSCDSVISNKTMDVDTGINTQQCHNSSTCIQGSKINSCVYCNQLEGTISLLLAKVNALENLVRNQGDQIDGLKSLVKDRSEDVINQLKPTYLEKAKSLQTDLPFINQEPSCSSIHSSHIQTISNRQTNHYSTPNNADNQRKNNTQTHSANQFKPKQNIIVNIEKDSEIFTKFDQDSVRRTICHAFGPLIIERVTRYNYNSEKPKLSIQFNDQQTAERIVASWQTNIFGSSTARTTVNPSSQAENSVMMYGVPIDCSDNEIEADITSSFPGSTAQRLSKDGKKLRTMRIKFTSSEQYKDALSNGILLKSQLIKCHCKPINVKSL